MPSVGSITYNYKPVTKTGVTTYTANNGELVLVDASSAAVQVTLPLNPTAGMQVAVKKTDATANKVTVISGSAATIDTDSSAVLLSQNSTGSFVYDGSSTSWKIVSTSVFNTASSQGVVPPAGTINQVLTKTGVADYAVGWAAPATTGGAAQPWSGGNWFNPGYQLPVTASYSTAYATYLSAIPVYVPNACTISSVNVTLGSTATTSIKLALYANGGTGITSLGPSTMIGSAVTYTMGSVSTNFTIPVSWTIPSASLYWAAYCLQQGYTMMAAYTTPTYQFTAQYSNNYLLYTAYTYSSTWPANLSAASPGYGSDKVPVISFYAT